MKQIWNKYDRTCQHNTKHTWKSCEHVKIRTYVHICFVLFSYLCVHICGAQHMTLIWNCYDNNVIWSRSYSVNTSCILCVSQFLWYLFHIHLICYGHDVFWPAGNSCKLQTTGTALPIYGLGFPFQMRPNSCSQKVVGGIWGSVDGQTCSNSLSVVYGFHGFTSPSPDKRNWQSNKSRSSTWSSLTCYLWDMFLVI